MLFRSDAALDKCAAEGSVEVILEEVRKTQKVLKAELKEAVADEAKSVAGFNDLKGSKEKEVEMATEAIETKMARAGELAVSVVQTKDALEDANDEAAETQKFAATLEKDCATKEADNAERTKMRNMEIAAMRSGVPRHHGHAFDHGALLRRIGRRALCARLSRAMA